MRNEELRNVVNKALRAIRGIQRRCDHISQHIPVMGFGATLPTVEPKDQTIVLKFAGYEMPIEKAIDLIEYQGFISPYSFGPLDYEEI